MKTKTLFLIGLIFIGSAFACFAEEASYKFSMSGLWIAEDSKTGGGTEFGINLLETDGFILRNFVICNGYGGTKSARYGEITLGDKIQIGGNILHDSLKFRPYGFLSTEFGLLFANYKKPFDSPFCVEICGGGGFEFQFIETSSFFVEYGGNGAIPVLMTESNKIDFQTGNNLLILGFRQYF